jgi:hypothetical protein|nr:MAG TPA: hypothetical protein [Caudoviricetes sp.]
MIKLLYERTTLDGKPSLVLDIRKALGIRKDVVLEEEEALNHFRRFILKIHVPYSFNKASFFQQKLMASSLPITKVWILR